MEIDNWQTMMLIFEVVCRIFKKTRRKIWNGLFGNYLV